MSEKPAIQIDNTKLGGNFQLSRVRVVFSEDHIAAVTKVYVDFILKLSELYEKDPKEIKLPAIPLLYSLLKSFELPPDKVFNTFTAVGDPGGRVDPNLSAVIDDLFEATY